MANIWEIVSGPRDAKGTQNRAWSLSAETSPGTFTLKRCVALPFSSPRYLTSTAQIHVGGWSSGRRGSTARARNWRAFVARARHAVNCSVRAFAAKDELCPSALSFFSFFFFDPDMSLTRVKFSGLINIFLPFLGPVHWNLTFNRPSFPGPSTLADLPDL